MAWDTKYWYSGVRPIKWMDGCASGQLASLFLYNSWSFLMEWTMATISFDPVLMERTVYN